MTNSLSLYDYAEENDIDVIEDSIPNGKLKGFYFENIIVLDTSINSDAELTSILAEEIGHYETSYGDILDQTNSNNQKQEIKARRWAHNKLIPLNKFIECYEAKCKTRHEVAEFLGVTEVFLEEAITQYQLKYGTHTEFGEYFIFFNPVGVMKKIK